MVAPGSVIFLGRPHLLYLRTTHNTLSSLACSVFRFKDTPLAFFGRAAVCTLADLGTFSCRETEYVNLRHTCVWCLSLAAWPSRTRTVVHGV